MVCISSIVWTYKDKQGDINYWSAKTGIPYQTLYHRREMLHYTIAQSLGFEPPPKRHRRDPPGRIKTSDGREGTYAQWSEWTGLPVNTIKKRYLTMKWSEDRTVNTPRNPKKSTKQSVQSMHQGASA